MPALRLNDLRTILIWNSHVNIDYKLNKWSHLFDSLRILFFQVNLKDHSNHRFWSGSVISMRSLQFRAPNVMHERFSALSLCQFSLHSNINRLADFVHCLYRMAYGHSSYFGKMHMPIANTRKLEFWMATNVSYLLLNIYFDTHQKVINCKHFISWLKAPFTSAKYIYCTQWNFRNWMAIIISLLQMDSIIQYSDLILPMANSFSTYVRRNPVLTYSI